MLIFWSSKMPLCVLVHHTRTQHPPASARAPTHTRTRESTHTHTKTTKRKPVRIPSPEKHSGRNDGSQSSYAYPPTTKERSDNDKPGRTGTFDAVWWPAILNNLRDLECPRNLYNLTKSYFSDRVVILCANTYKKERKVKKDCPQSSCCGPGYWNILYNALLDLEFSSHTKVIAFADDLAILTYGEKTSEAEA